MKEESLLEEMGENLLEETGDNLLEEKNNPAESENTTRQKQLMEQLQKELEAAKKQREEMERRTQELEAERKKAVEARKQAEKRAEEQQKRAEAERREREKRKKEAERSLSKEELEKRREKQIKNFFEIFKCVVVLIHLSFLLWISLDFYGAIKSPFFWVGVVVSSLWMTREEEYGSDYDKYYRKYSHGLPGVLLSWGWGLFIIYVFYCAVQAIINEFSS